MIKHSVKFIIFALCTVAVLLTLIITNILQINNLKKIVAEQTNLQPTQTQRYFYTMIDDLLLESNVQFVELNTTINGEVNEFDNSTYVIELTNITMIEISITFKSNFLNWYDESVDLNIYYSGFTEPDISYEGLRKTVTYTLALQNGFNTIELYNNSSYAWEYTITIREKN